MRMYFAVDIIQFKSRLSLSDICNFARLEIKNFLCVCRSPVLNLVIPVLEKFKSTGTIHGIPPKPHDVFLISLTSFPDVCQWNYKKEGCTKRTLNIIFFCPEWEMTANILLKGELRVLIFKVAGLLKFRIGNLADMPWKPPFCFIFSQSEYDQTNQIPLRRIKQGLLVEKASELANISGVSMKLQANLKQSLDKSINESAVQVCFHQVDRMNKLGLRVASLRQKPVVFPGDIYMWAVSNTLKLLCSQTNHYFARKGNGGVRFTCSSSPSQSLLLHVTVAINLTLIQQQLQRLWAWNVQERQNSRVARVTCLLRQHFFDKAVCIRWDASKRTLMQIRGSLFQLLLFLQAFLC